VNNELERMWKERSWPNLRYYPGIYLEELRKPRKTSGRIAGLRAESLAEYYILISSGKTLWCRLSFKSFISYGGISKIYKSNNNSIQFHFIYLRASQQPDKANYSQALKQQYRIKYNILKSTSALQMKK
jgi:hypothetical protein